MADQAAALLLCPRYVDKRTERQADCTNPMTVSRDSRASL
jgi:hypothetical protein